MSIHPCIVCDDEVRPRQQALQCDDNGRSYGLSDHMIVFCVVKVFMAFFLVWNGERFPLLLETNTAFRIVTQTYLNSEHACDRFLCGQSLRGIITNQKKVSQAYETSES